MLRHDILKDKGILLLRPEGALRADDFAAVGREVDEYLTKQADLNGVLIQAEEFPGWEDFGAMVSHLRFVRQHHRNIKRVALVTDSSLLTIMPRIASHFVSAQVRTFGSGERGDAMAWLSES